MRILSPFGILSRAFLLLASICQIGNSIGRRGGSDRNSGSREKGGRVLPVRVRGSARDSGDARISKVLQYKL